MIVDKDYTQDLVFKLNGEEIDYYNDIAGDFTELDLFLKRGRGSVKKEREKHDYFKQRTERVYLGKIRF